jgi:hypothetical protein
MITSLSIAVEKNLHLIKEINKSNNKLDKNGVKENKNLPISMPT